MHNLLLAAEAVGCVVFNTLNPAKQRAGGQNQQQGDSFLRYKKILRILAVSEQSRVEVHSMCFNVVFDWQPMEDVFVHVL